MLSQGPRPPPGISLGVPITDPPKNMVHKGSFHGQQARRQLRRWPLAGIHPAGRCWGWLLLLHLWSHQRAWKVMGRWDTGLIPRRVGSRGHHQSLSFGEPSPHFLPRLRARATCWDSQVEGEQASYARYLKWKMQLCVLVYGCLCMSTEHVRQA